VFKGSVVVNAEGAALDTDERGRGTLVTVRIPPCGEIPITSRLVAASLDSGDAVVVKNGPNLAKGEAGGEDAFFE
jgi:hypothetical protein